MFLCHFVDPDLAFEKEGTAEENIDSEIGGWGTCCTFVLGVQEDFKQSLSAFFFVTKKNSFWMFSWPAILYLDYWIL